MGWVCQRWGRRQEAEGTRQKAEGRRQEAGGRRQESELLPFAFRLSPFPPSQFPLVEIATEGGEVGIEGGLCDGCASGEFVGAHALLAQFGMQEA